jgi:hypothetical protein
MKKFLSCLALLALAAPAFGRDLTLGELRTRYVGHQIRILPGTAGFNVWHVVREDNGHFIDSLRDRDLADDAVGQIGTVVSLDSKKETSARSDVFGNVVDAEREVAPYFLIVVKLDDGRFVGTSSYEVTFKKSDAELVDVADKQQKEIQKRLDRLIGKAVYKTAYTQLFDPTLAVDELLKLHRPGTPSDRSVANLTPMLVRQAKIVPERHLILVLVELPDKQTRVLVGDIGSYQSIAQFPGQTELGMLDLSAEASIPKTFTKRECHAIVEREIFVGMSEDALWWARGYPDETNNWGSSGKQYIYGKHEFIYVRNEKIVDWQQLTQ